MGAAAPIGGAIGGILGGLTANQREGSKDAGNIFGSVKPGLLGQAGDHVTGALGGMDFLSSYATPGSQLGAAQSDISGNPMLGQLFGPGGTLGRTVGQEQEQASKGFSLQPEDYEAYGQGAGNISRMFGQNDQMLAQSLADRGLSSSGVAGQQFAGSLGNKQEQLGQLQMQIAQQRMKTNMDRLNQTRNFLSSMGGQAQEAVNSRINQGMEGQRLDDQHNNQMYNMGMGILGAYQGQQNAGLNQQMATEHGSNLHNAITGGMAGAGAMMGAAGGGGSAGPRMAGQSYSNGGVIA